MKILFFVQIILELIPISSSTHLKIISKLFDLKMLNFYEELLAHIPTGIVQAIFIFKLFKFHKEKNQLSNKENLYSLFAIFFSAIPTAIVKLLMPSFNDEFMIMGLFITVFILFFIKFNKKNNKYSLNIKEALFLGTIQILALMPGVSRFALFIFACQEMKFTYLYSFYLSMASGLALSLGGFSLYLLKYFILKDKLLLIYDINFKIYDVPIMIISTLISSYILKKVYFCYKKQGWQGFAIYELLFVFFILFINICNSFPDFINNMPMFF